MWKNRRLLAVEPDNSLLVRNHNRNDWPKARYLKGLLPSSIQPVQHLSNRSQNKQH
jgi:hypothetical protein